MSITRCKRGGQKTPQRETYEKTPAFKQGQRFRSGIEGRISVLFRGRGMKCCRAKRRERFELFVGAAVLANNLLRIAALLLEKKKQRKTLANRRPPPKLTCSLPPCSSQADLSFLVVHPTQIRQLSALPSYTTKRHTPVGNPFRTAGL